MKTVLVIAPHPDDETLGPGGTLLKHRAAGDSVGWLLVTGAMTPRLHEVARAYGFSQVFDLGFPAARLDTVPDADLVEALGRVVRSFGPEVVYLPFPGDVHSDHGQVFDAAVACVKSFRHPTVKRTLAYETLSETEFDLRPQGQGFRPNVFVDIAAQLEEKVGILKLYPDQIAPFPFPRSEEAVRALAAVRGAACGARAAEGFVLLREIA